MTLAKFQFHLTNHAYRQYCKRVGSIEYEELKQLCKEQISAGGHQRQRDFLKLQSVWWVIKVRQNTVHFVTCYGRSNLDLPRALSWAKRNKDRICINDV